MKKISFITLFIAFCSVFTIKAQITNNDFVTLWAPHYPNNSNINPSSTSTQIWFPVEGSDVTIYWEEAGYPSHNGTISHYNSYAQPNSQNPQILIDFGTPSSPSGTTGYMVAVKYQPGNFFIFGFTKWTIQSGGVFTNGIARGDSGKLLEIMRWGTSQFLFLPGAFVSCSGLQITAPDAPNIGNGSSFNSMFAGCNLSGSPLISPNATASNLSNWDTTNITDMKNMFANSKFNGNISGWNTSNVKDMSFMFDNNSYFNQPIGNWNTSNVTTMKAMFRWATAFNQSLANWDTSHVTDLSEMFFSSGWFGQKNANYATSENHNKSISSVGSWNLSSLNNAFDIFKGTPITIANYDAILNGWATNANTPNNINLGDVSSLTYSNAGAASRNTLINIKNWTIAGDHFNTLSTSETNKDFIKIFPNPTKDKIYFDDLKNISKVNIYNAQGRLVKTSLSKNNFTDLSPLNKGIYFIEVFSDGKSYKTKIIKE